MRVLLLVSFIIAYIVYRFRYCPVRDRRERDCMVKGFTNTCVIGAYHH